MQDIIWSAKEAERWQEAYLLGNGRMGAAVYGGVFEETVDLSEITFFSGSPSSENNQKGAALAFQEMRSLLQEGKEEAAMERASDFIGIRENYGTNLPVGRLKLTLENSGEKPDGYMRRLDLKTGLFSMEYRQEGSVVSRNAFVSWPDQVFCYEIKTGKPESLSGRIWVDGGENPFSACMEEGEYHFQVQAREKLHSDGSCGVDLSGTVKVWCEDGRISFPNGMIAFTGCSRLLIGLWMETDYEEKAGLTAGKEKKAGCKKLNLREEYDRICSRHREDVKSRMERVSLCLGTKEEQEAAAAVPTDERVLASRQGKEDPLLFALAFQFGRYLLQCSSREDSPLPAHLQGVWNDNVACRIGWTCDMHLDINTQMNYWLSGPGNLPECRRPLFAWMEKLLIPSGRISARESYGRKGWSADLVSNAWGFSAPYWSRTISPCPTGGIWQASDYMEYYRYTRDEAFAREHAYPVIREAVEFFTGYVFEGEDGRYLSGPSISPENAYIKEGEKRFFSNGCTYEILMIRELLEEFLELASFLPDLTQKDRTLVMQAEKILPRLLPYRILPDGTLAEWAHSHPAADSQHRHTSHLLGVFPYAQVTPEGTPELAEAAWKSMESRLCPEDNWEDTGWARSLLLLYSARLRRKEAASHHLRSMQKELTHPNLLVMHPPTRGAGSFMEVYELDGNTGLSMGIAEMLLQSHSGELRLLPCLPEEWDCGSVDGLLARGNVRVGIRWQEGRLEEARFTAARQSLVSLEYRGMHRPLSLKAGVTETVTGEFFMPVGT